MKPFLTFFLILFALTLSAQLQQKTWLVGGNGRFQSNKVDDRAPFDYNDGKVHELQLSANVGYFIRDKLVTGIRSSYNRYKADVVAGKSNANRLLVGPFARYYLLEKTKQANVLIDINYQIGSFIDLRKKTSTTNDFSIFLGTEFFFNTTAGIEFLIGYNSSKEKFDNGTKSKSGFQASIGFQIHLIK